jgi:hypothetical protein
MNKENISYKHPRPTYFYFSATAARTGKKDVRPVFLAQGTLRDDTDWDASSYNYTDREESVASGPIS